MYRRLCNIKVFLTKVESYNSFGLIEQYNQPLSNTYRKFSITLAQLPKALRLSRVIVAINDTLDIEGIASYTLVTDKYTYIWTAVIEQPSEPDLVEILRIAKNAQKEMERS